MSRLSMPEIYIKNFNYDQRNYSSYISKLLFYGTTVGICPLRLTAAAWVVIGHTDFPVQDSKEPISREFL